MYIHTESSVPSVFLLLFLSHTWDALQMTKQPTHSRSVTSVTREPSCCPCGVSKGLVPGFSCCVLSAFGFLCAVGEY